MNMTCGIWKILSGSNSIKDFESDKINHGESVLYVFIAYNAVRAVVTVYLEPCLLCSHLFFRVIFCSLKG